MDNFTVEELKIIKQSLISGGFINRAKNVKIIIKLTDLIEEGGK